MSNFCFFKQSMVESYPNCWCWSWKLGLISWLVISGAIASLGDRAIAQIIPDATLGSENSQVTSIGSNDQIDGGAIRETNLFHSFEQFNIDEGRGAYFTNPPGIKNILTRVTGRNSSNILATLGVRGNANLFLINPNGILFGPNARLDVRGSFVATTANGIYFNNQGFFSASTPDTPPLLTVNPSAFVFNQLAAGSITINSGRFLGFDPNYLLNGIEEPVYEGGLEVPDSQSLLLLGGNVSLDTGIVQAPSGRVELGSLEGTGTVGLNVNGSKLSLSFPQNVQRSRVSFNNGAGINVRGRGDGSITINARNIDVLGGSKLFAGLKTGVETVTSEVGDITLNATEGIITSGRRGNEMPGSYIFNTLAKNASGNTGDIKIKTGSLLMTDDSRLSAHSQGVGKSGSVSVQAGGSISLIDSALGTFTNEGDAQEVSVQAGGSLSLIDSAIGGTTYGSGKGANIKVQADGSIVLETSAIGGGSGDINTRAQGDAGDIYIQGQSISITEGTEVSSRAFGSGKAGNIQLNATDFVEIFGENPLFSLGKKKNIWSPDGKYSSLLTSSEAGASVKGGDISVNTGSLRISTGGTLSARSRSEARGGNIKIDANILELTGGGQLITTALSSGDAGKIDITATDRITVSGTNRTIYEVFKQFEGQSIKDGVLSYKIEDLIPHVITQSDESKVASGLFASTLKNSAGQGGDLTITTGQLTVQEGAQVTVSSEGRGNAGELKVKANNLLLDDQGKLQASTVSGEGGDINLQVRDLILMRRNSLISAEAGNDGNGGNINISSKFIFAVPSENSDIIANAEKGNGGRVNITAFGIFGIKYRDRLTSNSDITTSSVFGVDGVVEINTPNIEPNPELATLPAELVEVSGLIAQGCQANIKSRTSKFVITGRGGLPPTPQEVLTREQPLVDLGTPIQSREIAKGAVISNASTSEKISSPFVEAQGWVIGANGEVVLTRAPGSITPYIPWLTAADCHTPEMSSFTRGDS